MNGPIVPGHSNPLRIRLRSWDLEPRLALLLNTFDLVVTAA